MSNCLLYPENTKTRTVIDLSGLWKFAFDFASIGEKEHYPAGLPHPIDIPVPASFADFFTEKKYKEYVGDVWYEQDLYLDPAWKDKNIDLRFYAAAHRATVYLNGEKIAFHEGGFLPFSVAINPYAKFGEKNVLVVKVNNELSLTSLPAGQVRELKDGRKVAEPFFDFFNYSGLIRPVKLVITPKASILDISLVHSLEGKASITAIKTVVSDEDAQLKIEVYDAENHLVGSAEGMDAQVRIADVHLWQVRNAYLYRFEFSLFKQGQLADSYSLDVGIRTVRIEGNRLLINDKPVYLKGFGKHEDSPIAGRGFNLPYIKRDFELMKWIGANSFRTSHYPYSEEIYQLADKEGFLIIDELPACGMLISTRNFVAAATGEKVEPYFDYKVVQEVTLQNHLKALEETIARDKNHASVIAWSLFNEPDTVGGSHAREYFEKIFARCKELDPQKRPRSFAHIIESGPHRCKCTDLTDFVMLNRYYGWYLLGANQFDEGIEALDEELSEWDKFNKPVMFTEYGCDCIAGVNTLPAVQWTEDYAKEYFEAYHRVFDSHDCVMGEQVWNFADFRTTEGTWRVNGNKKGVFTREREPKLTAFCLKERWTNLPLDYKGNGKKIAK